MSLHGEALGLPRSEVCGFQADGRKSKALSDGTTLLFGLPGVRVQRVERRADGTRVVHVVTADETAAAHAAVHHLDRQRRALNTPPAASVPGVVHRFARPELLTLASTVDIWWPEITALIATSITNAATEGYNRLVK